MKKIIFESKRLAKLSGINEGISDRITGVAKGVSRRIASPMVRSVGNTKLGRAAGDKVRGTVHAAGEAKELYDMKKEMSEVSVMYRSERDAGLISGTDGLGEITVNNPSGLLGHPITPAFYEKGETDFRDNVYSLTLYLRGDNYPIKETLKRLDDMNITDIETLFGIVQVDGRYNLKSIGL